MPSGYWLLLFVCIELFDVILSIGSEDRHTPGVQQCRELLQGKRRDQDLEQGTEVYRATRWHEGCQHRKRAVGTGWAQGQYFGVTRY